MNREQNELLGYGLIFIGIPSTIGYILGKSKGAIIGASIIPSMFLLASIADNIHDKPKTNDGSLIF